MSQRSRSPRAAQRSPEADKGSSSTGSSSTSDVPGQPAPPSLVKANHHSVELTWGPKEKPPPGSKRPCYTVEMQDASKIHGEFETVYRGYSTTHLHSGLKELTKYNYRIRASNEQGHGKWSEVVTIATTSPPYTSKNLHKAVQQGKVKLVMAILKSNPNCINVPNIMGFSPLMIASASGKTDIVHVLLDMGADVNYKNSSGRTSLMEACFHGHVQCAELLVQHGSSCLTRDYSGFSSLHYAVDGGNIDMVNFVLNEKVPVDDVDSSTLSGWTPLMRVATLSGDAAIARVLIERGADVNKRDNEGNTVLMLATLNDLDELVKVLLENNANPLAKSEHGKTAVDFAAAFYRQEVYHLLTKKVAELTASKADSE